jgi:hypothetical protein
MAGYDLASSAHFQPAPAIYIGGAQPNAQRLNATPPPSVDNIAWDRRNPQTNAVEFWASQPEAWPYVFTGTGTPGSANAMQPYGRPAHSPQLAIPVVNPPPPTANAQTTISIALAAQPDPWQPADLMGDAGPYVPRKLNAGIPGGSIGPTPFDRRNAQTIQEAAALAQPDPFQYAAIGGLGPYLPPRIDAPDKAVPVNQPQPNADALANFFTELASQPDPWSFLFLGNQGPYIPAKINAGTNNFQANTPPFDRRNLQTLLELPAISQPDAWSYLYFGALGGPYMPNRSLANPGFETRAEPFPGFDKPAYQIDPWQFTFEGGAAPYLPRPLNAPVIFVEVDQPQPNEDFFAIIQAQWLNQPDLSFAWIYQANSCVGASPYQPAQLNAQILSVEVDFPPPNQLEQIDMQGMLLSQPDPWQYAMIGGLQPYAPRALNPTAMAVRVDSLPTTRQSAMPTILTSWIAPDVPPDAYPRQHYKQKIIVRLGRAHAFIIS